MPTPAHSTHDSSPFGALLRRYRTLVGMTQEALAARAGVSVRAVSDLERGVNQAPRAATLGLLADALRLEPADRAALIAAAHPDLDAPTTSSAPAGPPRISTPTRLPLPPTALIGREADLARGLRLLARPETRLLTITGPGGVGKTHLALELARQSAARFAAGVIFVDLSAVRDPALVPAALTLALGLREPSTGTPLDALKDALSDQRMLLLLDNVEQVVECASLLADLLAACPRPILLATSRTPLHLRAEQRLLLEPLAPPDAAALFTARAAAISDASDPALAFEDVAALCEQVDCLPLAIELCAAQLGALSLGDLRQRLRARMELPSAVARDLPARQRTLRQTIGWSYDLLSPSAQALFRRLAVFAGGCALPAIQTICKSEDDGAYDMTPDIAALVDASLLRMRQGEDGAARYEMLVTIHDDARERLRAAREEDHYASRHCDYFARVTDGEEAMTRELPNARAALAWAREAGQNIQGMTLLARFGRIWYHSGLLSELRGWLETFLALDAASEAPAPPSLRANTLFGLARLAYDRGEREDAARWAKESLAAARRADDAEGTSNALALLGQSAQASGAIDQAGEYFTESLAQARRCNVSHVLSAALGNSAQIAQAQGNLALAVALLEEALALARQNGSRWGEAVTQTLLGLLEFARSHYEEARGHYIQALALYRRMGSDVHLAWCLEGVAALDAAEGKYARAVTVSAGADELRASEQAPRPAGEQQAFERTLAVARQALGEQAYQRAWSAGMAAGRDALIQRALDEEASAGDIR